ncbi:MAG: DUF3108 domain-containing protein [Comamonadaceae bacterium]|nr:MAG: DUF3108 domain-containing protein [Comamonadaceae bacterium]
MARAGKLIWILALAVLLAHVVALQWLSSQWMEPELLKPLAKPMLTRQIAQQVPAALPLAPPARKRKQPPPALPAAEPVASLPESTRTLPDTSTVVAQLPAPAPPAADPPSTPSENTTPSTPSTPTPTLAAATPTLPPVSSTPAATATASYLDDWPADTRLSYKVSGYFRGELSGDAQVQWLRVKERYEVSINIGIGFLASTTMTSQGEIRREGLHPLAYQETGRGKPRKLTMTDSGIVFSNGNTLQRPQGVQDTASQFVELSQQFASGRTPLAVGSTVSFPMARPGAVDYWTYDVTEKVTLNTPRLGAVEAYHLKPRPLANPRGNITAEMWFAPSLQYLPVRIRINMGDAVNVDLMVEKIEQR